MDRLKFLLTAVILLVSVPTFGNQAASSDTVVAKTWRLTTISAIRTTPDGEIVDIWDSTTVFTARQIDDDWLTITGYFPDTTWQALEPPLWVPRYYADEVPTTPPATERTEPERYIVINKKNFLLQVLERQDQEDKVLYQAKVALGIDRCKPKELGGRCYYTRPGEYAVRWKIHDPQGIEWCIPKHMEPEYPDDIANGQRCFRGPMGNYALNIGGPYAIHGTNRPQLIGRKVSHGCVRVANTDMRKIYKLMGVGDKVIITEK